MDETESLFTGRIASWFFSSTIASLAARRARFRCCRQSTAESGMAMYGTMPGGSNSPNKNLAFSTRDRAESTSATDIRPSDNAIFEKIW